MVQNKLKWKIVSFHDDVTSSFLPVTQACKFQDIFIKD